MQVICDHSPFNDTDISLLPEKIKMGLIKLAVLSIKGGRQLRHSLTEATFKRVCNELTQLAAILLTDNLFN